MTINVILPELESEVQVGPNQWSTQYNDGVLYKEEDSEAKACILDTPTRCDKRVMDDYTFDIRRAYK